MNSKAQELGLSRSHFAVAHGMHNENNYSTAYDMGKLSCIMMRDERFREIVKTIEYECKSTRPKREEPDNLQNSEELKEEAKEQSHRPMKRKNNDS